MMAITKEVREFIDDEIAFHRAAADEQKQFMLDHSKQPGIDQMRNARTFHLVQVLRLKALLEKVAAVILVCLLPGLAMAQGVPIGALPQASLPLTGAELMALSQNGAAVRATVTQVNTAALSPIANNTVLGNVSGVTAAPTAISASQLATLLGLGTAAYQNTGSSGQTIPFLNGVNTWSGLQTFAGGAAISGTVTVGNLNVTGTTTLTNPLAISSGGTSAATAQGARLAILPSITGNANKALIVNPGETDFTYSATAVGSVTSVGLAGTAAEITVTGATPITSSGSWTLSLPTALTFTGKTITGGAFTGGTWNNGIIGGSTPAAITSTALTATGAVALSPANANVVLSPTGTGVVTISPATAGTLNNVAIGGSTARSGSFTTINASGVFTASNGTVSAPGITFAAQSTDGFYSVAAGTIGVTTGGLSVARFGSGNASNWLTFQSAAGQALVLADAAAGNIDLRLVSRASGNVRMETNGGTPQFYVSHTASAVNYAQMTGGASGTGPTLSAQGAGTDLDLRLTPKGAGYVYVTATGIKFPDLTTQTTAATGGLSLAAVQAAANSF